MAAAWTAAMRLALLPGLDGTGILFDPLVRCLRDDPPPLIVRYPPTCAGAISDYVDVVGDALSTDDRWLLLAESFSGPIAARLLTERPELKITGVVFAASFLSPPRPLAMTLLKHLPLGAILGLRSPTWLIKALCLGPSADGAAIGLLRDALTAAGPDTLAARLRLLANLPRPGPSPSLPCLYIRPTADRLVPTSSMRETARLISGMRICELDGPHFILQAEPDRCAQIIKAFAASIAETRDPRPAKVASAPEKGPLAPNCNHKFRFR